MYIYSLFNDYISNLYYVTLNDVLLVIYEFKDVEGCTPGLI